jgi:hypothetical protein
MGAFTQRFEKDYAPVREITEILGNRKRAV